MTDSELMAYLDEIEREVDRDIYDPDMTIALEEKYNHWREVSKSIHALHPMKRIETPGPVKWGKTVKVKLDNTQRFYYSHDMGVGFIWINETEVGAAKHVERSEQSL